MCGIAGFAGTRGLSDAPGVLLEILKCLQYRGYDSAGIVVRKRDASLRLCKVVGGVSELRKKVEKDGIFGDIGFGHTRWSTKGVPSVENAHPHWGGKNGKHNVAVVHNGNIENWNALKEGLISQGYTFVSGTDTEVIAHLIDSYLEKMRGTPMAAIQAALSQLTGSFAVGVMLKSVPDSMFACANGCPLFVGKSRGSYFVSSDYASLTAHAKEIAPLTDGDVVFLSAVGMQLWVWNGATRSDQLQFAPAEDEVEEPTLGTFPFYMPKEIHEQPRSLGRALQNRIHEAHCAVTFAGSRFSLEDWHSVQRIVFIGCGTSWHAGLIGEYLIEEFADLPVEVKYASEFRYATFPLEKGTLVVAMSQSGETADTLAAMKKCREQGCKVLAICNAKNSTIAREADGLILLKAGPEIGVASTKAFTSQVMVVTLLAIFLGRMRRTLSVSKRKTMLQRIQRLPCLALEALRCESSVIALAERYCTTRNFLYLGRGYNFPVALEGALKLKEISYIHAEGYPAAEMKHGPIALVEPQTPTVFIMPPPSVHEMYGKVMTSVEEVKSKNGPVIAIACENDTGIPTVADHVIYVPRVDEEYLQPVITVIPLQLLAYHIARLRGLDVDRPRNLAKSVTVE